MPQRIIIGALSGNQYQNRRTRVQDTWMRDAHRLGTDAVFLMGDPILKTPERRGDLLYLPCRDSYPGLPKKTLWFCKWALWIDSWDFLFKCDDDTFVFVNRLLEYDIANADYIGGECHPGAAFGSGGAGYLLSRRAAKIVAENLSGEDGPEDLFVGALLNRHGIHLKVEPRFFAHRHLLKQPLNESEFITLHDVPPEMHEEAYLLTRDGK